MALVTYIEHDGTPHQVNVPSGTSAMLGAVRNNIPGIIAECGGQCSCGTCHVYVDDQWAGQLPPASDGELAILEFSIDVAHNSRLACQIEMSDALDGLILRIPQSQT